MKRTWIGWMVLAVAVGCGQEAAQPGTTVPQTAGSGQDGYEIAVIPKGLSHQFWLTVKAGAEAAGEEFNAEIIWQGPAKETQIDKQIGIMEDMVSRNVDAIVMAACDENALVRTIKLATDAGITVVTDTAPSKIQHTSTWCSTATCSGPAARTSWTPA